MNSTNNEKQSELLQALRRFHLDDPASRARTITLHPRSPSSNSDTEQDPALEEALRRSRCETTLEESLLADALAASITTRDEELALALQREQLALHERTISSQKSPSTNPTTTTRRPPPIIRVSRRSSSTRLPSVSTTTSPAPKIPVEEGNSTPRCVSTNTPAVESVSSTHLHPTSTPPSRVTTLSEEPLIFSPGPPTLFSPVTPVFSSEYQGNHLEVGTAATGSLARPFLFGAGSSPDLNVEQNDRFESARSNSSTGDAPAVVIDGQNVGWAYGSFGGERTQFRARGVQIVLDYYAQQGIQSVALLPQAKVDERGGMYAERVADDPGLLLQLADSGQVAFTPAGAHDDHFLLQYAMSRGIDLISNDRFQKEIYEQETSERATGLRNFLRQHLIPYTFVQGEFIPYPNPARLGEADHSSRKK